MLMILLLFKMSFYKRHTYINKILVNRINIKYSDDRKKCYSLKNFLDAIQKNNVLSFSRTTSI